MVRKYSDILKEMLVAAGEGVDKRQGSFVYDNCAVAAYEIARFEAEFEQRAKRATMVTAQGSDLDDKAWEHGLTRHGAVCNVRKASFEGAVVQEGSRFFTEDGVYFKAAKRDGAVVVVAEEPGERANRVLPGTPLVPVATLMGLKSAVLGDNIVPGVAQEGDEPFRARLQKKVSSPPENGNRDHYRAWCESVEGVGVARIDSLWKGPNTVRSVLVGTDGKPATAQVVAEVQEYVDPGGTGLGEGVANIGAYFTAVAAKERPLVVSFTAQLAGTANEEEVREECYGKMEAYFKDLALTTEEKNSAIVRASTIANIIYQVDGILDYSNVKINDQENNVEIPFTETPVLSEVILDGV